MKRCPNCGEDNAERARFCQACGTPLTGVTDSHEERRVVSVLFVDLVGFTSKSEQLDPEDVHSLINAAFELMLAEVHRYEGTVNQFLGDGLMALLVAPLDHED